MKRMMMTVLTVFAAMSCLIAKPKAPIEKMIFYGVDFSEAKVCLATESIEDFREVFLRINTLLLEEPEKYDLGKALKADVSVEISPVWEKTEKADLSDMKTTTVNYQELDLEQIIKGYDLKETEGIGVIFIAELLNKPAGQATYSVVKFNIDTREIIQTKTVTASAGGFGLRNYWANSVYKAIKDMKKGF